MKQKQPARVGRRLAAIVAADVAGYSRLMGLDEVGTARTLREHRKVTDTLVATHGGRLVKTTGDGVLLEFPSVVDAVECAVAVQAVMAERNQGVPEDRRMLFRIGVNLGDVLIEGDDILGDGVNIAARLEGIAEPGGICVSSSAYDHVRNKVAVEFNDLGEQNLKNIERPVRAYAVKYAGHTSHETATSQLEARKPLPLPDKPSIAVLPFQNMSGDPEQEYFADGMVEEIITALSRNKQLFVIARNSSFTFKGKAVDLKKVAQDLGVRYLLEGSVRKSGNRIRITGQLIDVASGAHLWADKYDGALEDVFDLQDQVASGVVGAINPAVIDAEMERAKRKSTSNLDAYDCYLRGVAAHWQRGKTSENNVEAAHFFEQAVAMDPQFAAAHVQLAWTINNRIYWGWSSDRASDASRSIAYAERALQLGKNDPIVIAKSAGVLLFSGHDDVELLDSLLEEAIRLDPNGAGGWLYRGWTKSVLGDHETAINYFQHAIRLSPLDPSIFIAHSGIAWANFFLENYEDGLNHCAAAFRYEPRNLGTLRAAMVLHALSGNMEAAQKIWQQLLPHYPSGRISDVKPPLAWRGRDLAKLMKTYRLVEDRNEGVRRPS